MATALTNYLAPDRHYHNLNHINFMLRGLEHYFPSADTAVMRHAILYHDAIYDPLSNINEESSAEAAIYELRVQFGAADLTEIYRLIMLTSHHQPDGLDVPGCVIVDLDLAGLAAPNPAYIATSKAIRKEYHMVSDEQWRAGRVAFLEKFLSRKEIYYTILGGDVWEERARENMQAELRYLEALA